MSVTILSQAKKQSVTNCPLSILSGVSKKFASSLLAPFILASAERYTCLCYVASPTETTGEKLVTKSRITSETDLSRMWL